MAAPSPDSDLRLPDVAEFEGYLYGCQLSSERQNEGRNRVFIFPAPPRLRCGPEGVAACVKVTVVKVEVVPLEWDLAYLGAYEFKKNTVQLYVLCK